MEWECCGGVLKANSQNAGPSWQARLWPLKHERRFYAEISEFRKKLDLLDSQIPCLHLF